MACTNQSEHAVKLESIALSIRAFCDMFFWLVCPSVRPCCSPVVRFVLRIQQRRAHVFDYLTSRATVQTRSLIAERRLTFRSSNTPHDMPNACSGVSRGPEKRHAGQYDYRSRSQIGVLERARGHRVRFLFLLWPPTPPLLLPTCVKTFEPLQEERGHRFCRTLRVRQECSWLAGAQEAEKAQWISKSMARSCVWRGSFLCRLVPSRGSQSALRFRHWSRHSRAGATRDEYVDK